MLLFLFEPNTELENPWIWFIWWMFLHDSFIYHLINSFLALSFKWYRNDRGGTHTGFTFSFVWNFTSCFFSLPISTTFSGYLAKISCIWSFLFALISIMSTDSKAPGFLLKVVIPSCNAVFSDSVGSPWSRYNMPIHWDWWFTKWNSTSGFPIHR